MHCSTESGVLVLASLTTLTRWGSTLTEVKEGKATRSEARRSLRFNREDFLERQPRACQCPLLEQPPNQRHAVGHTSRR
jgi:hypothetical protein